MKIVIRLTGADLTPEKVPADVLAQILEAVQRLAGCELSLVEVRAEEEA